jgi:hypothetical protein
MFVVINQFKRSAYSVMALFLATSSTLAATLTPSDKLPVQYEVITLDVAGPNASETDLTPNPFLDFRYDVTFTSPAGTEFQVPGFFAGDGNGLGTGNVWRVRFTPNEPGEWQYNIRFLSGNGVAVADNLDSFTAVVFDSNTGTFSVAQADANSKGRLNYADAHYLQHENGEYWIKGGVDSPENFFGYAGFDNTVNQPGGVGEGTMVNGVHHYAEHIADWNSGDPLFVSDTSGVNSKGIIGAINYLASEGVNSMYFLLMNLGGDGRETYPFVGASGSNFDNTHYDVSKLHQWNIVLQHMQQKGVAAHLVLGEQEEGNRHWLDNGTLGTQRKLYYREMVARFTYLNALKWNISEESRFGDALNTSFANVISQLDWAKHPIAVHSFVDNPAKAYDGLIGNPIFSASSIQFSAEHADEFTEQWRAKTSASGRPWVIDMDEVGPGNVGLTDANTDELRRTVLYPVYFSGGNIEWYFGQSGADIRTEDFRSRQKMYRYMRYAREFMQTHLPFWDMQANDDALQGGHANNQVFEKPGDTYAVYLHRANDITQLSVVNGSYTLQWFNPRSGLFDSTQQQVNGPVIDIGPAPTQPEQDWVVLVKNTENPTPETQTGNGQVANEQPNGAQTNNAQTNNEQAQNETSATDQPPEVAAAQPDVVGGSFGIIFVLLLGFWRWCVLLRGFYVLRIQRIEVNRVQ